MGIMEISDSLTLILCEVTNIQNARIFSIGQSPCRKKRDPVNIRTKPLTGESMKSDTKNVSETAVVPVIINITTQLGRLYSFFLIPSIA